MYNVNMSKVYMSQYAYGETIEYIRALGHDVRLLAPSAKVYPAISCHPDIFMCSLDNRGQVYQGNEEKVGYNYPADIIYNAASTGKFFIHRLDMTDGDLLTTVRELGLSLINIKQGYSKCNICVVDENHIITSDEGIKKSCQGFDIDVLLISPGNILLPGLDHGFIGGASGSVSGKIIFNGDLSAHPDFQAIKDMVEAQGKELVYFKGKPLLDIGSIIEDRSKE